MDKNCKNFPTSAKAKSASGNLYSEWVPYLRERIIWINKFYKKAWFQAFMVLFPIKKAFYVPVNDH